MKLDMDLIRELLIWCEERLPYENQSLSTDDIEIPKYTHFQIVNHIILLTDNDYLVVDDASTFGDQFFFLKRLTLDGYQFLNLIRNDTVWKHLKETLGKAGLVALPVILTQITPYIKQLLGIP